MLAKKTNSKFFMALLGLIGSGVVLALLAVGCSSSSESSGPGTSPDTNPSQTNQPDQPAETTSPPASTTQSTEAPRPTTQYPPREAINNFRQNCSEEDAFEGRSAVVSVLTDDTTLMRIYADYEIRDCAGNSNSIEVSHRTVPEGASSDSIVTELSNPNTDFDVVQVDWNTLQRLIDQDLIYSLTEAFELYRFTYGLNDIRRIYTELASRDDEIYGIPATVDTSLIYFDTIARDQFEIPGFFATFDDAIEFCMDVNARSSEGVGDSDQPDAPITQRRQLTSNDFEHTIAIPLALPAERAELFGNILRSLGGSWLDDDNTPAFDSEIGVEALTTLRDLAMNCMSENALDYTQEDALRAFHNREITAAVLDASNAHFIYSDRHTTLWAQYEQNLENIVEIESNVLDCEANLLAAAELDAPEETILSEGDELSDESLSSPLDLDAPDLFEFDDGSLSDFELEARAECSEIVGGDIGSYSSLTSPIGYARLPSAGSDDNPSASPTEIKFFVFPKNSDIRDTLAIQLILETTDIDSQQSIKYYGVPTRFGVTPEIDESYADFSPETVLSPTNYDITFAAIINGLPPETLPNELILAKEIVGEAMSQLFDPATTPADILEQAGQDYLDQVS